MHRRALFRNFILIYAGATVIPACIHDEKKSALTLKNLRVGEDQEATLEALAETIIPQTDSPGARALGSHLFVLMMVDECRTPKEQENFMKGFDRFMNLAKEKMGTGFLQASPAQRTAFLQEVEKKDNMPGELISFYLTTKHLTIQSYTSSEYFLTKVQLYDMVPGRWHGCYPIKTNSANG